MASLTLEGVTKIFGAVRAVDTVSLDISTGEFVALLGPSGCGKTTLLRLLAGFERADAGTVRLNRTVIDGPDVHVPPERRGLGMVFQSYALWPHMTVADNVGYALRVQRLGKAERRRRVEAALAGVGLETLAGRRPADLSGGQRQRVALARCLAMEPPVVLLDEPLANLDVHLRESMQTEFRRLHRETGTTMVSVTHDQAEAMALADRVAVMHEGRVHQVDTPQRLFERPADTMVAAFVGKGTLVPVSPIGPMEAAEGQCRAELWGVEITARWDGQARPEPARACLRPDGLALEPADTPGTVPSRVRAALYQGAATLVTVAPDAAPDVTLTARVAGADAPAEGARVGVRVVDAWILGCPG